MFKLFTMMMKEEWRIHSTIFGSLSFSLFPVMIFGIALMGSFLLPVFRAVMPAGQMVAIIHALFLLLGLMVGGFGLIGMEAMNRRFGQASLISYSSRSLPLSERGIFATFVVKDTVYYFILWVFPFVAGFLLASPFIGIPLSLPLLLLLTLTLTFLTGLSLIFLLSTLYTRYRGALVVLITMAFVAVAGVYLTTSTTIAFLFPPFLLFYDFSYGMLAVAFAMIFVPSSVAVFLFSSEYTDTTRRFANAIRPLSEKLSMFPNPPLAAKDLVDLNRSGSLIGQTIFSFLIPLGLLWVLLSVLSRLLPPGGLLILFAILTGVIASTMYTWLTAFDSFSSYSCLPISVSDLLISKMCSFSVLQIIPLVLVTAVSIASGNISYLLPSLVLCLSVSAYAVAVTIYLTGLSPSVLVYDAKVLVMYLAALGAVLIILIILAFMNPLFAIVSVLLFLPCWLLIKSGFGRWEAQDQPGF